MLKRIAANALVAVLAVGFLSSCGVTYNTVTPITTTSKKAALVTLVQDTPGVCDVMSFPMNVTDLSLAGPNGAGTTPINAGAANPPIIRINLGCLRDFTTVLNVNSVPAGTYTNAQVWLSEPSMTFYDPTILPPTPPINVAQLTLAPLKFYTIPINPPLITTAGKGSVLVLDFDMLHMIQSITKSPTTEKILVTATPEFTVSTLSASGNLGFGEVDDLVGFVRSVQNPPPVPISLYDGSFNLQLLSASITGATDLAVNLESSTMLYGFSKLNQLVTNSFMEVDGYLDVDGNFVATQIEDEYVENPPSNILALIGPVTSVTMGPNGNVTSFNLWARDVEPSAPAVVALDTIVTVNLSASTVYQYSSRSANYANLTFGPSNISVGQELVVHGQVTVPSASSGPGAPVIPSTVAANAVYLKLQSIQGGFSSLIQVGSDNKTGAFMFSPCPTLLKGTPIMVFTYGQTAFVNLVGLSSLPGTPAQPTLLVKGLPFLEPQATTINGVAVPAGTLAIIAKQVHQLQ